jgi:hypothetical protein
VSARRYPVEPALGVAALILDELTGQFGHPVARAGGLVLFEPPG